MRVLVAGEEAVLERVLGVRRLSLGDTLREHLVPAVSMHACSHSASAKGLMGSQPARSRLALHARSPCCVPMRMQAPQLDRTALVAFMGQVLRSLPALTAREPSLAASLRYVHCVDVHCMDVHWRGSERAHARASVG